MTDSRPDTYAHIGLVRRYLQAAVDSLMRRMLEHDVTKLESPEREAYDVMTERLRGTEYGSEEYRATLREMKPAIRHHYDYNSHHPEHYQDGILGMSLLDLIEMLADWKAAAQRQKNPLTLIESIERNQDRWNYSDDVKRLLINTAYELWVVKEEGE